MSGRPRLVLDTNVLVSAVISPAGTPRRCLELAFAQGVLLISGPTWAELVEVLYRPRLRRYLGASEREGILHRVDARSERVAVTERIAACRDPKDDKFLEAAVSGRADVLVSGDEDLLVLHPFRGVAILTPAGFLEAVTP